MSSFVKVNDVARNQNRRTTNWHVMWRKKSGIGLPKYHKWHMFFSTKECWSSINIQHYVIAKSHFFLWSSNYSTQIFISCSIMILVQTISESMIPEVLQMVWYCYLTSEHVIYGHVVAEETRKARRKPPIRGNQQISSFLVHRNASCSRRIMRH